MNKITFLALAILALLAGAIIGWAATQTQYIMPQTATIPQLTLDTYLEGTLWTNNTSIDWGTLIPGTTYLQNLTIVNPNTFSVTIYLYTPDLPISWTLSWAPNATTIPANTRAMADIKLTPASTVIFGSYSWKTTIIGVSA